MFMRTVILFVAGAMSLSTAFGQDPGFEERFKMKTGRNTPAEEARREKASLAAKQAKAKLAMSCDKHGCCTRTEQEVAKTTTTLGDPGAEARFRMKFGRISPAEEARIAAAKRPAAEPVLVASARICEGDCCKHDK
jgi:hypothetical protein